MRLSENKAKDILRGKHSESELSDMISSSFSIDKAILKADVQTVIKKLDPLSQQIIYLHIWEGYPYKEIAQELNISYNNVRVKASRAYKKIEKLL